MVRNRRFLAVVKENSGIVNETKGHQ